jgi:hypothetical protein
MRCLQLVGVLLGLAVPAYGAAEEGCKEYDACALLTRVDVAKALGGKYGPGQKGTSSPSTSTAAEIRQCRYTGGPGSAQVGFTLRCASFGGNDFNAVRLELQTLFDSDAAVSGLGDEAYWGSKGELGQLNVLIGQNLSLVFTVHASEALTMSKAFAAVKKLAATVIRRL